MKGVIPGVVSVVIAVVVLCQALTPITCAGAISYVPGFIPEPPDGFALYKADHFDIYYDASSAVDLGEIIADSGHAYDTVSAFFGTYGYRTRIIVATDHGQYTTILNVDSLPANNVGSGWGDGDKGTIVIMPAAKTPNFKTVLAHEMVHIAMRSYIFGFKYTVPEWFSEGLAVYVSGDISPASRSVIEDDRRQNRIMSISLMEQLHERSTDQDTNVSDLGRAYVESGMIVEYIGERYGNDTLKVILSGFGPTGDLDRAFIQSIGLTPDNVADEWSRGLKEELDVRDGVAAYQQAWGNVTDHKGRPMPNQTVTLTSRRNGSLAFGKQYVAVTNASGYYLVNVTYGAMNVRAEKPNYDTVDLNFELQQGQALYMDLMLNGSAYEQRQAEAEAEARQHTVMAVVLAALNIAAVAMVLLVYWRRKK